jgi:DNA-binding transcriptional MerR regulator
VSARVGVETIRYYQRRGLLDEPRKPFRGYRHYPADMAMRDALTALVRQCEAGQAEGFCPIISVLARDE